ncbi:SH3 domain-containing protein [Streptomyces sp. NPDC047853]|uniref:SH3 domain-containing protein n=1 Tax=unclassified Streptomyces TaxID=2593676 RepID=UPI003456D748
MRGGASGAAQLRWTARPHRTHRANTGGPDPTRSGPAETGTGTGTGTGPSRAADAWDGGRGRGGHPRESDKNPQGESPRAFRSGPGTNYPSLGQVHRGQGFDVVELSGDWFKGTLWGGPSNVWIHWAYLDM